MKQKEVYALGVLEGIGAEKGLIALRMRCTAKGELYDNGKEHEIPFGEKICDEFEKNELKLSHPIGRFKEGDKIRLANLYDEDGDNDKFALKNLSLATARKLEEALVIENPSDDLFSVEVEGVLECLTNERGKISLRIKCTHKIYTSFDKDFDKNNGMHEKTEAFTEIVYGVIPKDNIRADVGFETLIAYKAGDKINLSRPVGEVGMYDIGNITLSVFHAKPIYKSKYIL